MAETLPTRLVEAFSSPLGMMVLVLALLGIAGTVAWAFWDKQRSGQSSAGATNAPLKPTAPPLLNNEIMRPAAMTNMSGASDGVLRNILIAIVAIVAVIIGAQFIVGGKAEKAGEDVADKTTPPAEQQQTAYVPPRGESLVECDEGPRWSSRDEDSDVFVGIEQETIKSYIVCAERNSAQFDVIDFKAENDGTPILNPVWHPMDLPILGTEQDLYYAKQQFALSRDEFNMVAGPGSEVADYDLFVAIGLAGFDIDTGVAEQRAANRGFHIARYVLEELRGEEDANDCKSPAVVHAITIGQYQRGGSTAAAENVPGALLAADTDPGQKPAGQRIKQSAPILFGIRYLQSTDVVPRNETEAERRVRLERRNNDLIQDFLRSQGTAIAGFNIRDFETPQSLFVENACSRPAIR